MYQSIDSTIRGVNVTFAGTQLAFTAVATGDGNATIIALFQERGDDIKMYTRDAHEEGALWQKANDIV